MTPSMSNIEKLINDVKNGKVSEQDTARQIDKWMKYSYQSGIQVGLTKPNEWETLCETCGKVYFPQADEKKMNGVTMWKGKCPRCNCFATLIPVRDWMYASGVGSGLID